MPSDVAAGLGRRQPFLRALDDQLALELIHRGEDVEDQMALSAGGLDVLLQHHQADVPLRSCSPRWIMCFSDRIARDIRVITNTSLERLELRLGHARDQLVPGRGPGAALSQDARRDDTQRCRGGAAAWRSPGRIGVEPAVDRGQHRSAGSSEPLVGEAPDSGLFLWLKEHAVAVEPISKNSPRRVCLSRINKPS